MAFVVTFSTQWKGSLIFIVQVALAIFQLPNPLLKLHLTLYTWPTNATQMLKNFGCSNILCIQKTPITIQSAKLAGFSIFN